MTQQTDHQRYLDTKFRAIEKMLQQNHEYNKLELKQIKENTEKTNGRVADHERRVRNLEDNYHKCPISDIVKRTEILEDETKKMRALALIFKSSTVLAALTAIGLTMQIFNII